MGSSLAVATLLYGGLAALVVGGTKAATSVAEEELVQVKFAAPPPQPSPPAPELVPQPVANPRPKAKRRALQAPDHVPQDKAKESHEPLAPADQAGPEDGFTDGVEGGTGSAAPPPPPPPPSLPPPKPEPLVAPVPARGNAIPPYSASARRKEIEGIVVVSFEVLENGSVGHVQIISGPEELRESVLKTVSQWRFAPARRGDKVVRIRQTKSIQFRLSDA
jgi:periplasmic protein TonB